MKTLLSLIMLLLVSSFVLADTAPKSADGEVSVKDGKFTVELANSPVRPALDKLFEAAGKSYTLTPVAAHTSILLDVSLRVENATFEQALDAIKFAAGLGYGVENGVYQIMTAEEYIEDYEPAHRTASVPTVNSTSAWYKPQQTNYTPVTLDIEAMPVEQAYAKLVRSLGADPLKWQFSGDLGKTIMPGARFYQFPFEKAAQMIVAAAGLVPPNSPEVVIKEKGRPRLSEIYRNPYLASGEIGAYRLPDGAWRYTIGANQQFGILSFVGNILSLAGATFSMAGPRPADGGSANRPIIIKLIDVTLDQALEAILEPVGLTYTKKDNLYIIQEPAEPQRARAVTIKTKLVAKDILAGKVKQSTPIGTPIISLPPGERGGVELEVEDATIVLSLSPEMSSDGQVKVSGSLSLLRSNLKPLDVQLSATLSPGKPQNLPPLIVYSSGKKRTELAITITATLTR
jgi:hypothetical protein